MIELLKAVLFGIVEGITEWLPISSTGHLILLNEFLKLDVTEAFYEMYQVVIQLGAILAVLSMHFYRLIVLWAHYLLPLMAVEVVSILLLVNILTFHKHSVPSRIFLRRLKTEQSCRINLISLFSRRNKHSC
mgnify:CR=1 FL=1